MKQAIKKGIKLLFTFIQALLHFIKTVVLKSLLYLTIVICTAILAPFIPFILWIFKAYELKASKLELSAPQAPIIKRKAPSIKPVNSYTYDNPKKEIKNS